MKKKVGELSDKERTVLFEMFLFQHSIKHFARTDNKLVIVFWGSDLQKTTTDLHRCIFVAHSLGFGFPQAFSINTEDFCYIWHSMPGVSEQELDEFINFERAVFEVYDDWMEHMAIFLKGIEVLGSFNNNNATPVTLEVLLPDEKTRAEMIEQHKKEGLADKSEKEYAVPFDKWIVNKQLGMYSDVGKCKIKNII